MTDWADVAAREWLDSAPKPVKKLPAESFGESFADLSKRWDRSTCEALAALLRRTREDERYEILSMLAEGGHVDDCVCGRCSAAASIRERRGVLVPWRNP